MMARGKLKTVCDSIKNIKNIKRHLKKVRPFGRAMPAATKINWNAIDKLEEKLRKLEVIRDELIITDKKRINRLEAIVDLLVEVLTEPVINIPMEKLNDINWDELIQVRRKRPSLTERLKAIKDIK